MKVALFDMDGTLTPPREKMSYKMAAALAAMQVQNFKIGIVTGSGMNYVKQQCSTMFDMSPVNHTTIEYFPCNGTKHFRYTQNNALATLIYESHMKDAIGIQRYNNIIYELASFQCRLGKKPYCDQIPLTGNFIDCRGSMINWCPIGRNAEQQDRAAWKKLDLKYDIRLNILNSFFNIDIFKDLEVKLGGSTSFDIFPKNWDKTFVLKNFDENDQIYFFGDRCEENGNDKEIYEEVSSRSNCRAFKTTGPEHTLRLIDNLLKGA